MFSVCIDASKGTSYYSKNITLQFYICDALHDLVLFVQFKKGEKYPWRSVNFSKVAGFTKINTPPWMFFMFFKLYKWYQIAQRNASHM